MKTRSTAFWPTLGASFWILSLYISFFGSVFFSIYVFFMQSEKSSMYYLLWLYFIWITFFDADTADKGGRRISWVRRLKVWRYFGSYFPIQLVKNGDFQLDPKMNYLFACFPHGCMCAGAYYSFACDTPIYRNLFPGMKPFLSVISFFFKVPFAREYALAMGAVSNSEASLNYLLSEPNGGNTIALMVGGAEEWVHTEQHKYTIYVKNRRGFIRLAMKNGVPIVPVFSFGETSLFYHFPESQHVFLKKLQRIGSVVKFRISSVWGRTIFKYIPTCFVPYRHPVTVVVDQPIFLEKCINPTKDDIERVNKIFVEKIIQLFESQKEKYLTDGKNVKLMVL